MWQQVVERREGEWNREWKEGTANRKKDRRREGTARRKRYQNHDRNEVKRRIEVLQNRKKKRRLKRIEQRGWVENRECTAGKEKRKKERK